MAPCRSPAASSAAPSTSCAGPRPVRPGDTLTAENEVLEVIPSASRPGTGRVRAACRLFNQDGALVLSYIATLVVRGS